MKQKASSKTTTGTIFRAAIAQVGPFLAFATPPHQMRGVFVDEDGDDAPAPKRAALNQPRTAWVNIGNVTSVTPRPLKIGKRLVSAIETQTTCLRVMGAAVDICADLATAIDAAKTAQAAQLTSTYAEGLMQKFPALGQTPPSASSMQFAPGFPMTAAETRAFVAKGKRKARRR